MVVNVSPCLSRTVGVGSWTVAHTERPTTSAASCSAMIATPATPAAVLLLLMYAVGAAVP